MKKLTVLFSVLFFAGLMSGNFMVLGEQKEAGKTESKIEHKPKPAPKSCREKCEDKYKDNKCSCKGGHGDARDCSRLCDCLHHCP